MISVPGYWEAHVVAARERAVRREVLAAAALPALLTAAREDGHSALSAVRVACDVADALMTELDKRRQVEEMTQ